MKGLNFLIGVLCSYISLASFLHVDIPGPWSAGSNSESNFIWGQYYDDSFSVAAIDVPASAASVIINFESSSKANVLIGFNRIPLTYSYDYGIFDTYSQLLTISSPQPGTIFVYVWGGSLLFSRKYFIGSPITHSFSLLSTIVSCTDPSAWGYFSSLSDYAPDAYIAWNDDLCKLKSHTIPQISTSPLYYDNTTGSSDPFVIVSTEFIRPSDIASQLSRSNEIIIASPAQPDSFDSCSYSPSPHSSSVFNVSASCLGCSNETELIQVSLASPLTFEECDLDSLSSTKVKVAPLFVSLPISGSQLRSTFRGMISSIPSNSEVLWVVMPVSDFKLELQFMCDENCSVSNLDSEYLCCNETYSDILANKSGIVIDFDLYYWSSAARNVNVSTDDCCSAHVHVNVPWSLGVNVTQWMIDDDVMLNSTFIIERTVHLTFADLMESIVYVSNDSSYQTIPAVNGVGYFMSTNESSASVILGWKLPLTNHMMGKWTVDVVVSSYGPSLWKSNSLSNFKQKEEKNQSAMFSLLSRQLLREQTEISGIKCIDSEIIHSQLSHGAVTDILELDNVKISGYLNFSIISSIQSCPSGNSGSDTLFISTTAVLYSARDAAYVKDFQTNVTSSNLMCLARVSTNFFYTASPLVTDDVDSDQIFMFSLSSQLQGLSSFTHRDVPSSRIVETESTFDDNVGWPSSVVDYLVPTNNTLNGSYTVAISSFVLSKTDGFLDSGNHHHGSFVISQFQFGNSLEGASSTAKGGVFVVTSSITVDNQLADMILSDSNCLPIAISIRCGGHPIAPWSRYSSAEDGGATIGETENSLSDSVRRNSLKMVAENNIQTSLFPSCPYSSSMNNGLSTLLKRSQEVQTISGRSKSISVSLEIARSSIPSFLSNQESCYVRYDANLSFVTVDLSKSEFTVSTTLKFFACTDKSCPPDRGSCRLSQLAGNGGSAVAYCKCKYPFGGEHCSKRSLSKVEFAGHLTLLLLSNLFMLPAIALAVYRRAFSVAVILSLSMIFSMLYHTCDMDAQCMGGLEFLSWYTMDIIFAALSIVTVVVYACNFENLFKSLQTHNTIIMLYGCMLVFLVIRDPFSAAIYISAGVVAFIAAVCSLTLHILGASRAISKKVKYALEENSSLTNTLLPMQASEKIVNASLEASIMCQDLANHLFSLVRNRGKLNQLTDSERFTITCTHGSFVAKEFLLPSAGSKTFFWGNICIAVTMFIMSFVIYESMETRNNYWYSHSLWHILIMSSSYFIMKARHDCDFLVCYAKLQNEIALVSIIEEKTSRQVAALNTTI